MVCRFEDLRCKEVICIKTGTKLGYPDDIEIEIKTAKIIKIIVFGRSKCFGLLGREEDFIIPWYDVEVIGEDTILISTDGIKSPPRHKGFFAELFK
ncbi:MAG: YlmC/YmxH family sporulation protein [Eubacterium sp.]|jgi:YlmC/YmxH family sporulation protein|nr:YlmC/YmxH family sporulation protein [Eubacterium sp.]